MLKGGSKIKLSAKRFALIIFVLMWGSLAIPPKQNPSKKGLTGFFAGFRKTASKLPGGGSRSGSPSQGDAKYQAWFQIYKALMITIVKLGDQINQFLTLFSPLSSISQQEQQLAWGRFRQSLQAAEMEIKQLKVKIKQQASHLQKSEKQILLRAVAFLKNFILKQLEDCERILQMELKMRPYVKELQNFMIQRNKYEKIIISHEGSIKTEREYRVKIRELYRTEYKMQFFFTKLLTNILLDTVCTNWKERQKYMLDYRKYFQIFCEQIFKSESLSLEEKAQLLKVIQRTRGIFAKLETLFIRIKSLCSGYMKLYRRNQQYFNSLRGYMLQATALWSIGPEMIPGSKFATILDNCWKLYNSLKHLQANLILKKELLEPQAMKMLWKSCTSLLSRLKFLEKCLLDEIRGLSVDLSQYYDEIDTVLHSHRGIYLSLVRYETEKGEGVRWRQVLGQIWEMEFSISQQGLWLMVNDGKGLPIHPQQVMLTITQSRQRLALLRIPRAERSALESQIQTTTLTSNIVWRIADHFLGKQQRELERSLQTGDRP